MAFDLKQLLKALLLSTSEPLEVKTIQQVVTRWHKAREAERSEVSSGNKSPENQEATSEPVEDGGELESPAPEESQAAVPSLVTAAQIREAADALKAEFEQRDPVVRVVEGPQGWRLAVSPRYSEWVRLLRNEPRPQRLSPAALETLAIIAYRQPVTRAEMETIRGVSIDSALNKLMELELVLVMGRAELPGRPRQYGTTERFLEYAGIRSLDELPASDVVTARELDQWIRKAEQGNTTTDEDVGLPGNEKLQQQELLDK
jgi:segregation and condensation protein B